MNRKSLIVGLLIIAGFITAQISRADTGTVDTEIVAAVKAGADEVKNLELRAIDTIKGDAAIMEKDRACRILRVIGTRDCIEAVVGLLGDEKLSAVARYALESMKYPEVDGALRDALGKTSGQIKVGIINTMAMRGNESNLAVLTPLVKDKDTDVAKASVWALGRIASPQAIKTLTDYYGSAPAKMRFAVADGLLNAADTLLAKGELKGALEVYSLLLKTDAPEHVRMGAFAGTIEAQPDKAVAMIIEAIGSDDWKIRGMAGDMIVTLKGEGITERFSGELRQMDSGTQVLVLGALVARGEVEPLRPVITKAVSSRSDEVRALAIKALGDVGNEGSVKVLVKVVESGRNEDDKTLAASSLRRLTGKKINGEIVKSMKSAKTSSKVKLIEILRDRDAAEAVDALLTEAGKKNDEIKTAAFKALADLAGGENQDEILELLVKLKGDTGRTEAERALIAVSRKLDKAEGTEPILAAMDSSVTTKCSLLRVLGGIGNTMAFAEVRRALEDGSSEVRDTAVRTLADWPDATAAKTLLEIFRTTSNQTHRVLALRGCVRQLSATKLASADTLKTAGELMKGARQAQEKTLVLSCAATSANPGAIAIVEPLLDDSSVRAEAELAMLAVIKNMTASAPEQARVAAKRLRNKAKSPAVKKDAAVTIELTTLFGDHIMAWQVSGPYSKPFADTFETPFAPEIPAEAETAVWHALPISTKSQRPWELNLQSVIRGRRKAGYVRTYVHSEKLQRAIIQLETDEGDKMWLNGELVHSSPKGPKGDSDGYWFEVDLREGWNTVLLKLTQDSGPWKFCLAIVKPDGETLEGLVINPSEPVK
ncbi:MAG: HEAT repeat domain-containing protein [Planctomycetota bacterium]|jgi:HEAT repeat protein